MGGAGLSAAAMAHGGPSAMATHQAAGNQSSHSGPPPGTSAAAPPPNLAALGADLLDKNQNLNLKQIRNTVDMPIVALDLYGGDGGDSGGGGLEVAMFPPKKKGDMGNATGIIQAKSLGCISSALYARRDDKEGASHRALRRLLNKSKGYETVFKDTLVKDSDGNPMIATATTIPKKSKGKKKNKSKTKDDPEDRKNSDETTEGGTSNSNVLTIPSPQLLLGARLTKHLHPATMAKFTLPVETDDDNTISNIIDEEDSNVTKSSIVSIRNGNLDGSTTSQNNDYDRITLNLQLHSDKKTLSVLPEEAVAILTAQAKKLAQQSSYDLSLHSKSKKLSDDEEDESYLDFPTAVALPGWACHDHTIDALSDACHCSGSVPPVLFQRSIAALAGTLVPTEVHEGQQRKLVSPRVCHILDEKKKERKEMVAKEEIEEKMNGGGGCCGGDEKKKKYSARYVPTVVMAGLTGDGVEYTAIQVGSPNEKSFGDGHCPLGEFKVIASVSYQHENPLSIAKKALVEFTDIVDDIYPELEDDGGIASFITYGTITSQLKLKDSIVKTLKSIQKEDGGGDDAVWHNRVPFSSTRDETVAIGTSVLAAISHGRIEGEPDVGDDNRMRPSIAVQNVSPCAVGVIYNFDGGRASSEWTEPKVIFDYDRRVPTSAHRIDFSASECVAIRKDRTLLDDEEKLYDEAQKWSKGKYNALREAAALDLRVRVVQRIERGGKWRGVGSVFTALTQNAEDDDNNGEGEKNSADSEVEGADDSKNKMAVETSTLELSLDSVGYIGVTLISDGQSIVQAVKSARSTSFWWYFRVLAAIVFFGGFFLKSITDDQTRKRDVKKVLAFYKNVAPGTINDGDERNAQYLCWKYKGKKDKLWRRLEAKYDHPMRELHEWDDEEEETGTHEKVDEDEEEEDLDKDPTKGSGSDRDL